MANADTSRPSEGSAIGSNSPKTPASRKPRSFRTRIAVLTMCAAGVVVAVFGAMAWLLVCNISIGRIDEAIMERGRRHLSGHHGPGSWGGLIHSFDSVYGGDAEPALIILARDAEGQIIYTSYNWPRDLSTNLCPTPDASRALMPWPAGPPGPPPPGPPPDLPPPDERQGAPPSATPPMPPDEPREARHESPRGMEPPRFFALRASQREWRIGVLSDGVTALVLGLDVDAFAPDIRWMLDAFLLALPLALLLAGALGWIVSGRTLHPLSVLTAAAESVTARGLDQRIEEEAYDAEFARLLTVFNAMLDRLEKSFGQAVRFSADAAHELKTPLTILQGHLEQGLQAAPSDSDDQRRYGELLEEVHRLKSVVRSLLLLSLADSGQLTPTLAPFDLSEALADVVDDTRLIAPQLTAQADIAPDQWVNADADLLPQVLRNLASNAIKYNCAEGSIEFVLRRQGNTIELAVTNTGPGIPTDAQERVFERFFRGDQAHGRRVDGVGLGLSLSREITRAHGGNLVLTPRDDGLTTFIMTLPAASISGEHEAT